MCRLLLVSMHVWTVSLPPKKGGGHAAGWSDSEWTTDPKPVQRRMHPTQWRHVVPLGQADVTQSSGETEYDSADRVAQQFESS